jgi:dGTPase
MDKFDKNGGSDVIEKKNTDEEGSNNKGNLSYSSPYELRTSEYCNEISKNINIGENISDKKYGFFQSDKDFFKEVAEELGMIPNKSGNDIGFERHPLAFLVEAADDICYTIIDFEDGINLGLVSEDFALEYLIKLVKDTIDTAKYQTLTTKEDRISYLRALAIGNLINDAVRVFIENEEAILKGEFHFALTDKSKYKAQMDDIIKLSVKNIYQSREVI